MALVVLNVVAMVNLLLVAVLLLIKRPCKKANRVLAFIILDPVAAMTLLVMIYYKVAAAYPVVFYISYLLDFLWAPLFYYYVRLVLHQEIRFTVKSLLHFSLFIAGSIFLLWFGLQPEAYRDEVLALAQTDNYPWQFYILDYLTVLQVAIYLPICYRIVKKHNRHIEQVFSNADALSAPWLQEFIIINGIAAILMYFPLITNAELIFPLIFVPLASLGVYCCLVYKAISSPLIFSQQTLQIISETKEVTATENNPDTQKLSENELELTNTIETLFAQKKLFLAPDLNIQMLAEQCNTRVHILSALVNKHYNKTFLDFINYYRIEEAKRLLADPAQQKYSIDTIARKSGFSSRSVFYTAFRKNTASTPGEYIKSFANKN
jgi:AraC-like DNA-binding protein